MLLVCYPTVVVGKTVGHCPIVGPSIILEGPTQLAISDSSVYRNIDYQFKKLYDYLKLIWKKGKVIAFKKQ